MVFSDLFFIFVFLPLFMVCYFLGYLIDRKWLSAVGQNTMTVRNAVLVVFSLIFYAWGEPVYVFLMLVSVMINYLVGLGIDSQVKYRRAMLVIGLACNIAILGTFKYLGFFAQILNDIGLTISVPKISLPIGISFYTFQSISYLIDIYRREVPVQKRFTDLLLYISMFPNS